MMNEEEWDKWFEKELSKEEEWTSEKRKENSILDPKDTRPPWFLTPHPPENLQRGKLLHRNHKKSPYPLDKYLIGFRGWIWDKHSKNLTAVGHKTPWPKEEPFHATCNLETHDAPAKGCYCGIWCFKNPKVLVTKVRHYFDSNVTGVLGSVAIWGKVFEHKLGYRAEWAYPLSLETYGLTIDEQIELVEAYGVSTVEIAANPKDKAKTEKEKIVERAKQAGIILPNPGDINQLGTFY